MLKVLILLVVAVTARCQTPTPTPVPTPAPANTLPSQLVFGAASYTDQPGEKWAGTLSYASRVSTTAQAYSYTSWDIGITRVAGKATFSNSTRTGGAVLLRQFGNVYIFALGTAGITTVNAAVSASGSFGALFAYKQTSWKFFPWADIQKSNTTGTTGRIGAGYTW
jgi:hypothetical protein